MNPLQKILHYAFNFDYVYFDGKIFSGRLRVRWLPNGEAYVMLDKMIRIPNKLPPEGIHLGEGNERARITPLTPGITWYAEKE